MEVLHTERRTLVALEDRARLKRMLGARIPTAWPGAYFASMLPRIARGFEQAEPTRLIVHTIRRTLIGETGFHGLPDASGTDEVGYSTVPDLLRAGVRYRGHARPDRAPSNGPPCAGSPPSALTTTSPRSGCSRSWGCGAQVSEAERCTSNSVGSELLSCPR